MKKLKLITVIISILVSSNCLFAKNPLNGDATNIANIMIDKLGKDIQLSDSQKVIILQKATDFIIKIQNANLSSTNNDKFTLKKQASEEYRMTLDSLLTNEQREQKKVKCKEREDHAKLGL